MNKLLCASLAWGEGGSVTEREETFDHPQRYAILWERVRGAERSEIIWGMCKPAGGPPLFQTFYTAVISDG